MLFCKQLCLKIPIFAYLDFFPNLLWNPCHLQNIGQKFSLQTILNLQKYSTGTSNEIIYLGKCLTRHTFKAKQGEKLSKFSSPSPWSSQGDQPQGNSKAKGFDKKGDPASTKDNIHQDDNGQWQGPSERAAWLSAAGPKNSIFQLLM